AVGEQPEGPAGVPLVGPRPGDRVGQGGLGGGGVDAAAPGLGGGEADGGDLRVGEHDPGDPVVGGGAVAAQDVVGDDAALVHGDVGEQGDPGDVPERPQALPRPAPLIDGDGAVLAGLDADSVQ